MIFPTNIEHTTWNWIKTSFYPTLRRTCFLLSKLSVVILRELTKCNSTRLSVNWIVFECVGMLFMFLKLSIKLSKQWNWGRWVMIRSWVKTVKAKALFLLYSSHLPHKWRLLCNTPNKQFPAKQLQKKSICKQPDACVRRQWDDSWQALTHNEASTCLLQQALKRNKACHEVIQ